MKCNWNIYNYQKLSYHNNYFVDKRKIFENYQDKMGFIESFRLYEIYKLNGDIVEDIKKVGEDHDHLFQAWLYPKNTDSLLQPQCQFYETAFFPTPISR